MDNAVKIGCILQSYAEEEKKYKAFFSDSLEILLNEEFIGEADTYQEICKLISKKIAEKGYYQEPYTRTLMGSTATFIDFGSWSKFAAIVPPVSNQEICGES